MEKSKISIDSFFDSEEVKKLAESTIVPAVELTRQQKCAIIKAVWYIISADNVITSEERHFFLKLSVELEANEDMVKEASELSDEDMFRLLQIVNDNQDGYLASCLSKAAMADQYLAEEESKLLDVFGKYVPKGKKPEEFYNKIMNF